MVFLPIENQILLIRASLLAPKPRPVRLLLRRQGDLDLLVRRAAPISLQLLMKLRSKNGQCRRWRSNNCGDSGGYPRCDGGVNYARPMGVDVVSGTTQLGIG